MVNPGVPNSSQIPEAAPVAPDRIRSKSLRNLLNYWDTKVADLQRLPSRADLQPDEMVTFLPFVALINVQNGFPRFQFRLVGTGIVGAMGREATNRSVDEALFGANAPNVEAFFSLPLDNRGPAYATGQYTVAPSGRTLAFETLLLPLSSDGTAIDMLLGGLVGERVQRDEQICGFQYDFFSPLVQTATP
ncbi:MAG: PAS domain-containing protein [Ferrovibrio sp.]|jgi:hypothetical protein|uniref:PAS domain-containing protein n=1 Tax=Ferrovibrio sp. TaxID=1917215 RepID=UPI0039187782